MSNQQSPFHVCGLYYNVPFGGWRLEKQYLPQVQLDAHTTILAAISRTVLTQTFFNPSTEKGIRKCRYTFPLYDGVSVVGFTCHVGEREIVGKVKEKEKAKAVFKEAVARGETAGLFEQLPDASDVFTTTVGNIPPGAKVVIRITYLGELKHDFEVDGTRFTIPTIICPRYGNYPGTLQRSPVTDAMGSSISITVDVEMADGSFIQKMQSPTHPIAMIMGTTSMAPNSEPAMTKASATLTLGNAGLETDFVLQVIAKSSGVPKAILENHPTIADHRALMATLVPKFSLPPEKPEIVFVCDRSGSMGGTRIELAKQALKVFLKSLPIGVKFNICSFGWQHTFLWPRSVTYNQQSLDEAMAHADSFAANYGGTEMLQPLKATIEQRYKDMSLEIMMLTDGETWDQQNLFSYLNETITEHKAPIRVFTLGIGNGVSHALIEGIAKAGDGFAQIVGEGEKMDIKVVRMLKGALSPHINRYTLEVKYNNDDVSAHLDVEEEEDFEIVEKVADSLKVKLGLKEEKPVSEKPKKPISLFDPSADPDEEEPSVRDETGEQRYAHLPTVFVPKIIQAPQGIPSLFAFNRTTVYLLLGPEAPQGTPKSVILRSTSAHGPLELEIPVQILDAPGETIHQLAAKKAISELEQGRGWLAEAKDESEMLIKTKYEGRFTDMVECEAVRLGVQFRVGGKWCSFIAVESNKNEAEKQGKQSKDWEWLEDEKNDATLNQQVQMRNYIQPVNFFKKAFVSTSPSAASPTPFGQSSQFAAPTASAGSPFASKSPGSDSTLFASFGSSSGKPSFGSNSSRGAHLGVTSSSSGSSLFGATKSNVGGLLGASNQSRDPNSLSGLSSFPASRASIFGNQDQSSAAAGAVNYMDRGAATPYGLGSSTYDSTVGMGSYGQAPFSPVTPVGIRGGLFGTSPSTRGGHGGRGGLFGGASQRQSTLTQHTGDRRFGGSGNAGGISMFGAPSQGGLFGGSAQNQNPTPQNVGGSLFGGLGGSPAFGSSNQSGSSLFGVPRQDRNSGGASTQSGRSDLQDYQSGLMILEQQNKNRKTLVSQSTVSATPQVVQASADGSGGLPIDAAELLKDFDAEKWRREGGVVECRDPMQIETTTTSTQKSSTEIATAFPAIPLEGEALLHHLISLQTFAGSWAFTSDLLVALGLDEEQVEAKMENIDEIVFATALVVTVLEERLAEWNGSWELVVDKARSWLYGEVREERTNEYCARALELLK